MGDGVTEMWAMWASHALLDKKADRVTILDVRGMTSFADTLVIASADTERQVRAMAEHVLDTLRTKGVSLLSKEGETPGNWVLLDFGQLVVHLFQTDSRAYYDLEALWPHARRKNVA